MTDPIYLDHNATTPIRPEVLDAMLPYLREHFGNPSSAHVYGRRAKDAVEAARAQVAALLGASEDEIVFTSGGTEASNLAIVGSFGRPDRRGIVTSTIEHPATEQPCVKLAVRGARVTRVGVDAEGRLALDEAIDAIDERTGLVTVMHSNNETGTLQPIEALAAAAHARGALVHTDAAQSVGKVPVRVDALGVDLLTVAGHKLYAPKGVGALYVRAGIDLEPVVRGAGHERGRRPGTENVASIVGLGEACALAGVELEREAARVRALGERLFDRLAGAVPGLAQNGHPTARLPNTVNVRFPRVSGRALLDRAPGVAASTGSACHDEGETASGVITAMGVDPVAALGSVRLSLGRGTREEDVDRAAELLAEAWQKLA